MLMGNPPATIATMMDETVLEDCMSAVAVIPMTSAAIGFSANSKSDLAWSEVAILKPVPMIETAVSIK